jgi:hypothetical protein
VDVEFVKIHLLLFTSFKSYEGFILSNKFNFDILQKNMYFSTKYNFGKNVKI